MWRLWKALPEDKRRVLRFWFHTQVNTIEEPPCQLDSNLRSKLVDFFRTDVCELERLSGKRVPWQEFSHPSQAGSPRIASP